MLLSDSILFLTHLSWNQKPDLPTLMHLAQNHSKRKEKNIDSYKYLHFFYQNIFEMQYIAYSRCAQKLFVLQYYFTYVYDTNTAPVIIWEWEWALLARYVYTYKEFIIQKLHSATEGQQRDRTQMIKEYTNIQIGNVQNSKNTIYNVDNYVCRCLLCAN